MAKIEIHHWTPQLGKQCKKIEVLNDVVNPCPVCGKLPFVSVLEEDEDGEYSAKAHCPEWHIDCGGYDSSIEDALAEWNRRTEDETQPDLYKPTNLDLIRRFTPEQLARFIAWLAPNYCHNAFRPEYHSETRESGRTITSCDGKCTACILRFLEAKDGIYRKHSSDIHPFDPETNWKTVGWPAGKED